MATAVAASYINIPLAHIQGGEVTGSIDEKVRHSVTKLADLHFVASEPAAARVIRMGERPDTVHVTGCPSIDVAKQALAHPDPGFDVFSRYTGVGPCFSLDEGYIVVLQHSVTTEHGDSRRHILETLHAVDDSGVPTLWFWPNVDAGSDGTSSGIRAFRENHQPEKIHFFRSLAPEDFLRVLQASRCIVGNSSVAIRECAYMGVPAVNIGSRQLGRDRGSNVVDVDYDRGAIRAALEEHVSNGHAEPDMLYGDGSAGVRIADHLATVDLNVHKRLAY
jgi:UDP-hydrolysing UDP-N-acetyl-D-glucosamine 2-epimerase